MKYEDMKNEILEIMDSIDNSVFFYPLKRYGVKYIREETIETVKLCYIIQSLGFNITINLVHEILDRGSRTSIATTLSKLGDKRILYFYGYEPSATQRKTPMMVYVFNKDFIESFKYENKRLKALVSKIIIEGVQL